MQKTYLGIKPTNEQREIIKGVRDRDNIVTHALAGVGKEQPLYSKILTKDGWKQMKDMCIGTKVCNPSGGYNTVLSIHPQGKKDVYQFTFSDGSIVECGLEHLWYVKSKNWNRPENKGYRVVSTKELLTKRLKNNSGYIFEVPLTVVDYPKKDLPIHPYLLGCLLGDGSLHESIALSSHINDKFIIDKCIDLLPNGTAAGNCRHTSKNGIQQYFKNDKGKTNTPHSLKIAITGLGLIDSYSHNKFIPKIYLYSSNADRLQLLQGLMDTDGSVVTHNKVRYSTTSITLANDITTLVRSLGGLTTIGTQTKSNKRTIYNLQIRFNSLNPFTLPRKQNLVSSRLQNSVRKSIVNIRKLDKAVEQQCISLDGNHLYITDDFVVTHNTKTCVIAAIANPTLQFLYLTFSSKLVEEMKEVQEENNIKNLTVRSLHSLSMRYTSHRFGYTLRKFLHINDIKKVFPTNNYSQNKEIMDNLNLFCNSDETLDDLDKDTKRLWNYIVKSKRLTYGVYAKNFILLIAEDKISLNKFDYIVLDEVQDLSPSFMQLIKYTKDVKHLILGDKYQAIYDFLLQGYKTFNHIPKDYTQLTLSQSFRCSHSIAKEANKFIHTFLDTDIDIEFKGTKYIKPDKGSTLAMLTRTNAQVIQSIIKVIAKKKKFSLKSDIETIFEIPIQVESLLGSSQYSQCKNMLELKSVYDGFDTQLLKDILSYKYNRGHRKYSLADYLKSESNIEIQASAKLLEKLPQGKTFKSIKKEAKLYYTPKSKIQLLTIHASKGLGFDNVIFVFDTNVADIYEASLNRWCEKHHNKIIDEEYTDYTIEDFYAKFSKDREVIEELNLLYVAYTRAKNRVYQGNDDFKFDTIQQVFNKMRNYIQRTYTKNMFPYIFIDERGM